MLEGSVAQPELGSDLMFNEYMCLLDEEGPVSHPSPSLRAAGFHANTGRSGSIGAGVERGLCRRE
jgi:hypothetical protein